MKIELDKVPMRQQNMKAWELLLSESQERMLMVVQKGREAEVLAVFEKWDLPCSEIGLVTTTGLLEFSMGFRSNLTGCRTRPWWRSPAI